MVIYLVHCKLAPIKKLSKHSDFKIGHMQKFIFYFYGFFTQPEAAAACN